MGKNLSPILAILALSDDESLSDLTFEWDVNMDCAERIWELCKAVKRVTVDFLALLMDILNEQAQYSSWPAAPIVLKAVKLAVALPQEESATTLWYPLLEDLRKLRGRMFGDVMVNAKDRRLITTYVDTIIGLVGERYSVRGISSISHLRILSCSQASTSLHAATGWLRLYEDMSKGFDHGVGKLVSMRS
jgi:hypothetical protein